MDDALSDTDTPEDSQNDDAATPTMPAANPVQLIKIVLAGDAGVGKTLMLHRYLQLVNAGSGSAEALTLPPAKPTIGVEFATCEVKATDGTKIVAQIWDTAGQERYRAVTKVCL